MQYYFRVAQFYATYEWKCMCFIFFGCCCILLLMMMILIFVLNFAISIDSVRKHSITANNDLTKCFYWGGSEPQHWSSRKSMSVNKFFLHISIWMPISVNDLAIYEEKQAKQQQQQQIIYTLKITTWSICLNWEQISISLHFISAFRKLAIITCIHMIESS